MLLQKILGTQNRQNFFDLVKTKKFSFAHFLVIINIFWGPAGPEQS